MEQETSKNLQSAVKHWWLSLLLGILLIIMGIWVIRTPLASYIGLSILFGWLLFISGVIEMVFSIGNKDTLRGWGWHLASGIIDFILGGFLIFNPDITMVILPFLVGIWMMFGGVSAIAMSMELKSHGTKGWGWNLVMGILTIIFSFLVIYNPVLGGFYLVFMTAFALITLGIYRIMLSLKLKKLHDTIA